MEDMNRRRFLAVVPTAAVAGCLSSDETATAGTTTFTDEPTRQPTSTQDTPTESTQDATDLEDVSTRATASPEKGEPLTVPGAAQLTGHRWPADYDHRGYTSGVVGRVENIGDNRLGRIYVEVNFLDEEGTIIGEGWDSVQFIRPGEFYDIHLPYNGDAPSERVAEYELVLRPDTDPITPLNSGEVDITEQQWGRIDETGYGVAGTATNVGEDRLRSVILTVNFYDGNHLLYERKDKVSRVGPGQSFEWSVGYYRDDPPSEAVEDYAVIVQVNE